MEVCPSCGTIAPESYEACKICEASFGQGRLTVTAPDEGLMLVRLCGEFDCRGCGSKVALNYFTLDGYRCTNCGIKQAFDGDLWEQIVNHAHNTADLTGFCRPDDGDRGFWEAFIKEEGGDTVRMYRSIGRDRSTLTKGNSHFGGVAFEMDVSPGNPLCSECGTPLWIRVDQTASIVSCERCNDSRSYALVDGKDEASGLVATICHESRTDAPTVRTTSAGGSAALATSCPNCGGALEIREAGKIVRCPFCSTPCHVPYRVYQEGTGLGIPKEAWWMVFRGKSKQRVAVEKRLAPVRPAPQAEQPHELKLANQQIILEQQERRRRRTLVTVLLIAGVVVALLAVTTLASLAL